MNYEPLRQKCRLVAEALGTPAGEKLVALLLDEFDRDDLRGTTVEETYFRLGQRDVVNYLLRLMENASE
jgi:hypothetical protein